MNDFERFERALQAAAASGNVDAARQIAAEMRVLMQSQNPSLGERLPSEIEGARLAAKETGVSGALAIGAGRAFDRIGSGVSALTNQARLLPGGPAGPMPDGFDRSPPKAIAADARTNLSSIAKDQADKDVAYSALQKEHPFATSIGESAPYLSMAGAPSAGVLGSSALVGGVEASKYGTPEERVQRGLLGFGTSVVGGLLGKAVGKAIAPVDNSAVTGVQRTALDTMDDIGVKSRLSQVTGSPTVARIEDWASRTPGGAGVFRDFNQANQTAINRAAARSIGETADDVSAPVLARAGERMGKVFESIKTLGGRPIQIGPKVGSAADDILRQQGKLPAQLQDQTLVQLANQAKALAGNKGRIDGEAYQLIRSGLSSASFDASGSNKVLYGKLLEALDDSADSSLRAAGHASIADSLKSVRPQYGNLKTLEKGAIAEAGNVSPARVASALRTNNPAAFREGKMAGNPLYDIAQYGEAFKPLQQGSQTYERTLLSNPLATLVGAGPAYLAAKATTSPMLQLYPRYIGGSAAAGLLSQAANPAVRAGAMGLLQSPAGPFAPFLLPVMAE